MAVRPEVVLYVLLVALLVTAGQGEDLESMRLVFEGDHDAAVAAPTTGDDALVVAGGTVTVPAGTATGGSLYVVGGNVTVAGTVPGDVVQIDGTLVLADDASVGGDLKVIGGEVDVAEGATVEGVREVGVVRADVATETGGSLPVVLVQTAVLAAVGFVLGRRSPTLLRNVGLAITDHPLVSGTVGSLAAVVSAALFVVMAFTIVLIPVSVLGVGVGFLVVGYATVVYGHLVGEFVRHYVAIEDAGLATAVGVVVFSVLLRVAGLVPVLGSLVSLGVVVTGLGAVLVTYFGYRRFEPAT